MDELGSLLKDFLVAPAHLGFVVADLDAAVAEAAQLYGFSESEVDFFPATSVPASTRFAFFTVAGMTFEYIQPVNEHFKQLLFAVPSGSAGINHIAWVVSDIYAAVSALAQRGIRPGYVTPDGVVNTGRKLMVYLDPATTAGQLVELIEEPS